MTQIFKISLQYRKKNPGTYIIGPPGSCKTMLAKSLSTIMPAFILEEALETTRIHFVAGKIDDHTALMTRRKPICQYPSLIKEFFCCQYSKNLNN